jgi:hypothetical protein
VKVTQQVQLVRKPAEVEDHLVTILHQAPPLSA